MEEQIENKVRFHNGLDHLDHENYCNRKSPQAKETDAIFVKPFSASTTSYGSSTQSNNKKNSGNFQNDRKLRFGNLSRRQKMVLILCCITYFLEGVAFSIIAPFFPSKAISKGMSLVLTGLVFSGFQLVVFIMSPLIGANMRHLGPKFTVLSGTFLAGSCTILFGLLDRCPPGNSFIILTFLCRGLEAIGFTAYLAGLCSLVSTEFPDDISTSFGMMETANGIGMMIGPALGGALFELGGYELPFFLIGILVLSNMVCFWRLIPDVIPTPEAKHKSSQWSALKSPTILITVLAIVIASSARSFRNPILSLYLQTLGLKEGVISLIFIVPILFYTCFCPLWGYLTDKKRLTLYLMVIGNFLFAVGYLIMGPSDFLPFLPTSLWNIILGLMVSGTSFGCIFVPSFKLMQIGAVSLGLERDNLDTMALIASLLQVGYSLGCFTGTSAAGMLADAFGYANAFAVIGISNLFMALLLLFYFVIRKDYLNTYVTQM